MYSCIPDTGQIDECFGHIGEFLPSREEWDQYAECMGHFSNLSAIQSEERIKEGLLAYLNNYS